MKITRQDLYDRIWSEPMKNVAPEFGMSDVALRKHCTRANIPVPERGYWARLRAGKNLIKIALPARNPGQSNWVLIGENRYAWNPPTREELHGPIPERPTFSEPIDEIEAEATRRVGKVAAKRDLTAPHVAIRKLLDADEARREKTRNSSYGFHWDKPKFESPFERRRLRILNSLFVALAKLDVSASISDKDGRDIYFAVGDTSVRIYLDLPKNIARDDRYDRLIEGEPTSPIKLMISAGGWKDAEPIAWEDKGEDKLETKLSEVAIKIIVSGEQQLREQIDAQHEWWLERRATLLECERKAKEAAEQAERERLARLAKQRVDRLITQAEDLRRADAIRHYVSSVRGRAADDQRDHLLEWEEWALAVADTLDPITTGRFLRENEPDIGPVDEDEVEEDAENGNSRLGPFDPDC